MTNPKTSPVAESVVEQVARAICNVNQADDSDWGVYLDDARAAIAAIPRPIEDDTPTDAGEGVKHKPWYETDAHRDLSRIIPDMEGKIAEAETKYAHCLPKHLFSPLNASITELRSLRHEIAHPTPTDTGLVGELASLRLASEQCDPVLLENPKPHILANLLRLGAEHQRPRSRQFSRGEYNAEADAIFIVEAIKFARTALFKAKDTRHG